MIWTIQQEGESLKPACPVKFHPVEFIEHSTGAKLISQGSILSKENKEIQENPFLTPGKIMIRYNKLPENIVELLPPAARYLESHPRVVFSYLFGSLAVGSPAPLSDVDIAVFLSDPTCAAEDKLEIMGDLTDILQTDEIDLVILNTAELPLVMNALKNKRILVDKDPFARHRFESLTMRKYFDFSIRESTLLRRRYLHG